jgi:hypothetical protein
MSYPSAMVVRRRNRRYVTLVALVLVIAAAWAAFWKYAEGAARGNLAGWKAREAEAGRVYDCGAQTTGGFPFRFEVVCDGASAVIRGVAAPIEIKTSNVHIATQVYQPNLLITEVTGPLTIGEPGRPPLFTADWKLAQSSVRGTPHDPQRVSVVVDAPTVKQAGVAQPLFAADRLELHARMLEGSAQANPVIEVVARTVKMSTPIAGPAAAMPVSLEIDAVLRGLGSLKPEPLPQRLREFAQAGGKVEVRQVRLERGDTLAVGSGELTLNPQGRLEGRLNTTVAGAESLINDIAAANRQKLGFSISISSGLLGGNKKLDGRPAMSLPLAVRDGLIYLGPLKLGEVPPLF